MDKIREYWSGLEVKGADGEFPQQIFDEWLQQIKGLYCYAFLVDPITSAKVCILSLLVGTGWFSPCTGSPVLYALCGDVVPVT